MDKNLLSLFDLKDILSDRPKIHLEETLPRFKIVMGENKTSNFVVNACTDFIQYKSQIFPIVTILQHSYSKNHYFYIHTVSEEVLTIMKMSEGRSYWLDLVQSTGWQTTLYISNYFTSLGFMTMSYDDVLRCMSEGEVIEYTHKPVNSLAETWNITPIHTRVVDVSKLGTAGLFNTKPPLGKQIRNEMIQQIESLELKIRKLRTMYTLDELEQLPCYSKLVNLLQQPSL